MRYRNENLSGTHQHGGWLDYIGPDSMTHWIMEKFQGFTDVGLYRISESIRTYMYLILSLQASVRSDIIGNMASALTAQKAFLNNIKNVVNCRVDIQEDIKRYQDTMGENIYILPRDMNLKIRSETVGHSKKFLICDSTFSLRKNDKVNTSVPKKSGHRAPIMHAYETSIVYAPSKHLNHHA